MPKYILPNGKTIISEQPLSDQDLEALVSESMGSSTSPSDDFPEDLRNAPPPSSGGSPVWNALDWTFNKPVTTIISDIQRWNNEAYKKNAAQYEDLGLGALADEFNDPYTSGALRTVGQGVRGVVQPIREALQGGEQFFADQVTNQLTPANIASAGAFGLEQAGLRAGWAALNPAGRMLNKAIGAGNVLHGAGNVLSPNSTWGERASGAVETLLGGFGLFHGGKPNVAGKAEDIAARVAAGPIDDAGEALAAGANETQAAIEAAMARRGGGPISGPEATPTVAPNVPPIPRSPAGGMIGTAPAGHSATFPEGVGTKKVPFTIGPNNYTPEFATNLDRALWTIASGGRPSAEDAAMLKFVMQATGMTEQEARAAGAIVRGKVKAAASGQPGGKLSLPQLHEMPPTPSVDPNLNQGAGNPELAGSTPYLPFAEQLPIRTQLPGEVVTSKSVSADWPGYEHVANTPDGNEIWRRTGTTSTVDPDAFPGDVVRPDMQNPNPGMSFLSPDQPAWTGQGQITPEAVSAFVERRNAPRTGEIIISPDNPRMKEIRQQGYTPIRRNPDGTWVMIKQESGVLPTAPPTTPEISTGGGGMPQVETPDKVKQLRDRLLNILNETEGEPIETPTQTRSRNIRKQSTEPQYAAVPAGESRGRLIAPDEEMGFSGGEPPYGSTRSYSRDMPNDIDIEPEGIVDKVGANPKPSNLTKPKAPQALPLDIYDPHAQYRATPVGDVQTFSPDQLGARKVSDLMKLGYKYQDITDEGKVIFKKVTASPDVRVPADPIQNVSLFREAINLPRTLMASLDLSAPLRQGLGLIHKGTFWKALPAMMKGWGSQEAYQQVMESILDNPMFRRTVSASGKVMPSFAEEAGLKLTNLSSNVAQREESMLATMAGKIPGVSASNRAYTAFLNKLRADTFVQMNRDFQYYSGIGKMQNLAVAKQVASFINAASGRGNLGPLEKSSKALADIFFSPRLIASRLQMMGQGGRALFSPSVYMLRSPNVRREYLKSLFAIAAASGSFVTLMKQAGAKVEGDIASSDFGKVRFGNTRIDPYGGFMQYIVAAQRLMPSLDLSQLGLGKIGGRMKSTTTGRQYSLDDPGFGRSSREDVLNRFIRSKTNPIINFAWGMMAHKTELSGKPMDFSWNPNRPVGSALENAVAQRFVPMLIQDINELIKDETASPQAKAMAGFLSAVGLNTQVYEGNTNPSEPPEEPGDVNIFDQPYVGY